MKFNEEFTRQAVNFSIEACKFLDDVFVLVSQKIEVRAYPAS